MSTKMEREVQDKVRKFTNSFTEKVRAVYPTFRSTPYMSGCGWMGCRARYPARNNFDVFICYKCGKVVLFIGSTSEETLGYIDPNRECIT